MSKEIGVEISERERVIQGLREFADFLEAHPIVPVSEQRFFSYVATREQMATIARATSWEKNYDLGSNYFSLAKRFQSGATLDICTDRSNVCRKVVTGQRVVPATDERTEDIVEWVCEDASLLRAEGK